MRHRYVDRHLCETTVAFIIGGTNVAMHPAFSSTAKLRLLYPLTYDHGVALLINTSKDPNVRRSRSLPI